MEQSDEEQGDVTSTSMGQPQDYSSATKQEGDGKSYTWSPTEVLNFTMLQWLPGPEAVGRLIRLLNPVWWWADRQS